MQRQAISRSLAGCMSAAMKMVSRASLNQGVSQSAVAISLTMAGFGFSREIMALWWKIHSSGKWMLVTTGTSFLRKANNRRSQDFAIQQSSMGGGPTTVAGMTAPGRWLLSVTLSNAAGPAGE